MNEGGDDESVWCRKIGDKEGVGNVPENPQHPSPEQGNKSFKEAELNAVPVSKRHVQSWDTLLCEFRAFSVSL